MRWIDAARTRLRPLLGLSLDLKLGLRMLGKYPGLALVGGLGMALATAVGTAGFVVVNSYFFPEVPVPQGDRLVTLIKFDTRYRFEDSRVLHDFYVWKRELRSITELGAFRTVNRNLIGETGEGEPVTIAEMTASGFRVAGASALRGRTLVEDDERPGAPPVVVIGHDVWQSRFGGDPSVLGRTIRLGRDVRTVVGIMPPQFGFPINHSWWVPMPVDPAATVEPGSGPNLEVFGRLAPGATKASAEAELAVLGRRLEAERTQRWGGDDEKRVDHLRWFVPPYTDLTVQAEVNDGGLATYRILQGVLSLLLVLVCLNVAVLVYARTITRTGEIAVRTALGASRGRIVGQLFAEALVLSLLSALAGLGLVAFGLSRLDQFIMAGGANKLPFWVDPGLSAGTVLYALALAVLGAVITGVLPALRATGAQLRSAMVGFGGGAKAQLGHTWTFLIVAQVAIAVAALPPALHNGGAMLGMSLQEPGFPAGEYLSAHFSIDKPENAAGAATASADSAGADSAGADSTRTTIPRLVALLEAEPGVTGVTVAGGNLPGDGGLDDMEMDTPSGIAELGTRVRTTSVAPNYFDVFGVRVLAGRSFATGDAALKAGRPVIVNRHFVTHGLGGGEAVGRRIRYQVGGDKPEPWLEIVGVVEDFPTGFKHPMDPGSKLYHLVMPEERTAGSVFVRLRGRTPREFAPTVHRLAVSVDPMLQLFSTEPLSARYETAGKEGLMVALAIAAVTVSVLLLSAAGIHALMSFTVNRRRKEIGIRMALGADTRRILTGVLARAAWQLALGVGVGLVLAVGLDAASGGELLGGKGLTLAPVVAALMVVVGLLAAAGPARRGLRVHPTEAIRAE